MPPPSRRNRESAPQAAGRRLETPNNRLKFLTNFNSRRRDSAVIPMLIFPRERAHVMIAKTGGALEPS